ncbi:MAG: sugar ABC transporter permease [Clostridia bacterium]|nr:sugar ABC transporter permease [Clostridia bacterium]
MQGSRSEQGSVKSAQGTAAPRHPGRRNTRTVLIRASRCWELYLFLVPAIVLIALFNYWPMYGIQIAFRDYKPLLGITGGKYVGLKHFERLIHLPAFVQIVRNTFRLAALGIVLGFPFPILLAITLNQLRSERFKRIVQTVTYLPHFISTVVLVGMLFVFLSPSYGIWGAIANALGLEARNIMGEKGMFKWVYVISGIWQNCGWDAIIYLAALSSIDTALYEAAMIDGANRWQRIWYIDIPSIIPTMTILLILSSGGFLSVGFDKVFLMQKDATLSVSETISTYTYKMGLVNSQYSFSTAVSLLNTLVNFVVLFIVNFIAGKVGETSLW